MSAHAYVVALLQGLEARMPPPTLPNAVASAHHGIVVNGDVLTLHVWVAAARSQQVFLDASDFEKPVEQLVDEIVTAVKSNEMAPHPWEA